MQCTQCGKPNPRMQAPGGTGTPVPPPQPQNTANQQDYGQADGNTVPSQTYNQQYSAPQQAYQQPQQQNVQQPNYSQQGYQQPQQNYTPQPEPKKKSGGKIALLIILPAVGVLLLAGVLLGIVFREEIADLFRNEPTQRTTEETDETMPSSNSLSELLDGSTDETDETEPLPSSQSMIDMLEGSTEESGEESTEEPETTEPETTTEAETTTTTEAETTTTEEETTTTEPETTTTEAETTTTAEEGLSALERQMVGFWIGDQTSEITMREDHSCFYQEPNNVNNERVYNGVDCEWRIVGNRLLIVGAADYIIYADLDPGTDNNVIRVRSDAEEWNTEDFVRQ